MRVQGYWSSQVPVRMNKMAKPNMTSAGERLHDDDCAARREAARGVGAGCPRARIAWPVPTPSADSKFVEQPRRQARECLRDRSRGRRSQLCDVTALRVPRSSRSVR